MLFKVQAGEVYMCVCDRERDRDRERHREREVPKTDLEA